MKRNIIIVLALVVALVVVALVMAGNKKGDSGTKDPAVLEKQRKEDLSKPYETERIIKQNTQASLTAFPEGFPLEDGARAGESFKYVPANSTAQQSTVQYVSNKSLAENGRIFKDYLDSSGFDTVNDLENDARIFYYATKDNDDLSISIESRNNTVTVSASYLNR